MKTFYYQNVKSKICNHLYKQKHCHAKKRFFYAMAKKKVGRKILWVSPLVYPNLFGTKGFVVVVLMAKKKKFMAILHLYHDGRKCGL